MGISANLIISASLFSLFLFYQKLHLKNFGGASEALNIALLIFTFGGTIYGASFLIYWGYKIDWLQAITLFAIGFIAQLIWFSIEAILKLRSLYWVFSLLGFAVIPVSGYFMWAAIP